ncbi:copper resistance protein CopC [Streptomyces sp. enrichment culture]|uniref:copper resistance CopC/CopD family protein n=1 Tax=Streptomyces sp. enrichment culture TaxID=1795815 RepID=UPI003F5613CA
MLLGTVLALLLGGASPAPAHSALRGTDPEDGSVVPRAPRHVTLTFTESVGLLDDSFRIFGPDQRRVPTGGAAHADGRSDTARVRLTGKLAQGTYTVAWRVVSADSHPVSGAFTFSVGKRSATTFQLDTGPEEDPLTDGLYDLARYLAYLAAALLVGSAAFAALCRPADPTPLRRPLAAAWWTLLGATAVLLLLRAPYETGAGPLAAFDAGALDRTLSSRPGLALLARLVVLLLIAAFLVRVSRGPVRHRPVTVAAGTALAVGLALTWAVAEHASAGIQVPVAMASSVVHLLATGVWLGGLVALLLTLRRAPVDDLTEVVPRFSRAAFTCVVVLAVTGLYQSWRGLGSLSALTGTSYGRLLLLKLAAVSALLLAAGHARRWTARIAAPPAAVRTALPERVLQPVGAGAAATGTAATGTAATGVAATGAAAAGRDGVGPDGTGPDAGDPDGDDARDARDAEAAGIAGIAGGAVAGAAGQERLERPGKAAAGQRPDHAGPGGSGGPEKPGGAGGANGSGGPSVPGGSGATGVSGGLSVPGGAGGANGSGGPSVAGGSGARGGSGGPSDPGGPGDAGVSGGLSVPGGAGGANGSGGPSVAGGSGATGVSGGLSVLGGLSIPGGSADGSGSGGPSDPSRPGDAGVSGGLSVLAGPGDANGSGGPSGSGGPGDEGGSDGPSDSARRRGLRRSVLVEVAVAAVVLALTTVLTSTLPGRAEAEAARRAPAGALPPTTQVTVPFDTGSGGLTGRGTVQVTLDPARVGENGVQAVVYGADTGLVVVPEVRVTFSLPSRELGPIDAELKDRGGYWGTNSVNLPLPGTWTMRTTVRVSDVDQVTEEKRVRIVP